MADGEGSFSGLHSVHRLTKDKNLCYEKQSLSLSYRLKNELEGGSR